MVEDYDKLTYLELVKLKEEKEEEREKIFGEMFKLMKLKTVKRYLELESDSNELTADLMDLSYNIRLKRMLECKHIWISTFSHKVFNGLDWREENHFCCIKCGLDTEMEKNARNNPELYTTETETMSKVLPQNSGGIELDAICDKDLALCLYKNIMRVKPDLSDDELVEEFMKSLKSLKNESRGKILRP